VAQGRNQALEDALALSETIEEAFRKGDFSAGSFRPYEDRRRPAVELLQHQSDEMVLFWNSGFPPVCWLRDRVFKTLDRAPALRYKMLSLIAGLSAESFSWKDRLAAAGFGARGGPEGKK
jgi:2-polyprenyl-6-methoxyphenol hydroxylase-like FAD-dependent oxidoreductase